MTLTNAVSGCLFVCLGKLLESCVNAFWEAGAVVGAEYADDAAGFSEHNASD